MFFIDKKKVIRTFRFTELENQKLINDAQKKGLSVSQYFRQKIFLEVDINPSLDFNRKEFLNMRKNIKNENNYRYTIKNGITTVLNLARASYLVSLGKHINMKVILSTINDYEKLYNILPKDVRDDLIVDIKNLRELRDEEKIRNILGFYKIADTKLISKQQNKISFVEDSMREIYE